MPFEHHQEKTYPHDERTVYQAALNAVGKLDGRLIASDPAKFQLEARFPKVILGKTVGERTQLACQVRAQAQGSSVVVDAYPLDVLERKLMFGARKGVTLTVVTWFLAHLEHNLTQKV